MTFLKKNIIYIVAVALCILIIVVNFDFSRLVIGLDNASPYFNIKDVLGRIEGTSSVVYGGILFQAPLISFLQFTGLQAEVISNIYLSVNLILGVIGISLLTKRFTKNNVASIFSILILISSLFTYWIFSNPNFLFIASYGSIPLLIYLLSEDKITKWNLFWLIILSIIFLTTTLNIVAFIIYLLQIIIITFILSKKKNTLKTLLLWSSILLITWILSIQITMFINGDYSFFVVKIGEYITNLLKNPYMNEITTDILASEKGNSIFDVMRFSTGWMQLHDSRNIPIFKYYDLYKNSISFLFLGITPFLLALITVSLKKSKRILSLTALLIVFLLITSSVGITAIETVPFLTDALRWPTSKLWPIYIIPLTMLSGMTTSYLMKTRKVIRYIAMSTVFVLLIIYSLPVLSGNLISPTTSVNIPEEYSLIPRDSKILVLPKPQKLYMRQYEWGYYGSDFLSYINNSEFIDGANLYEYASEYELIFDSKVIPTDIDYILYDSNAEINLDEESLTDAKELLIGCKEVSSNKYFKIYEKE